MILAIHLAEIAGGIVALALILRAGYRAIRLLEAILVAIVELRRDLNKHESEPAQLAHRRRSS